MSVFRDGKELRRQREEKQRLLQGGERVTGGGEMHGREQPAELFSQYQPQGSEPDAIFKQPQASEQPFETYADVAHHRQTRSLYQGHSGWNANGLITSQPDTVTPSPSHFSQSLPLSHQQPTQQQDHSPSRSHESLTGGESIWTSEAVKALSNSQPSDASPAEGETKKKSSYYRQRRIDRVSVLLRDRYVRITNEANSALLVDTHTGEVVPEVIDAISAPLATQYRNAHGAEVYIGEIKRALDHFGQSVPPWEAKIFFGRAGYDPQNRQRYIDAAPGSCLTFDNYASYYRVVEGQPRIRPTQSRPLANLAHIGNWHPGLVNSLFDHTVLSPESDLLLIAWMILSWMPDRKLVMLELLGAASASLEQAHTLVRNVVDPATVAERNDLPSNVKQFNDLALKHYLLSFNHVEALTPTQQDHLFSLMRGKQVEWQWKGNKVDVDITVQCPVMLNSPESVATTPKLADATLSVEVEEDDHHYAMPGQMPSTEPAIVAGLLMIFGQVNAQWWKVEYDKDFDRYGGLADLCRVGVLVAECLRQDTDAFWQQFWANQRGRREFELEESPVALAVKMMLDDEPTGVIDISVKEWQERLEAYRPEGASSELWPTRSRGVGAKFKQIKPLLRDIGITLTSRGQRGPLRYWRAEKTMPPYMNE
ncbi:hypothetical protein QC823_01595 [Halomonas vilamensis]|uniref:Uncharacterized protein n=1 Tax=Vreelandella vilamensis TaxID=531309 RepID=A0ABU1H065_9GAMM|nr:hypothetical protein [Halomonas vilamensis]MDR5897691.1 hypothetical protein [Halomonas vilamensis]